MPIRVVQQKRGPEAETERQHFANIIIKEMTDGQWSWSTTSDEQREQAIGAVARILQEIYMVGATKRSGGEGDSVTVYTSFVISGADPDAAHRNATEFLKEGGLEYDEFTFGSLDLMFPA